MIALMVVNSLSTHPHMHVYNVHVCVYLHVLRTHNAISILHALAHLADPSDLTAFDQLIFTYTCRYNIHVHACT